MNRRVEFFRKHLMAMAVIVAMVFAGLFAFSGFEAYATEDDSQSVTPPASVKIIQQITGYEAALVAWEPVISSEGQVYYEVRDVNNNIVKYETSKKGKKEHYQSAGNTAAATGITVTNVRIPIAKDVHGRLPETVKYKVIAYIIKDGNRVESQAVETSDIRIIHPMYVEFQVKKGTKYYANKKAKKSLGKLKAGTKYIAFGGDRVKGAEDSTLLMKIKGKTVYVKARDVVKVKQRYNSKKKYTNAEVLSYINDAGLDSKPRMKKAAEKKRPRRMIWVNTYNQRVYLFTGSKGKWTIEKNLPASTGAGKILTPYGFNRVASKWAKKPTTGTRWWCIFNAVGIHQKLKPALGKPASGGCVRIPTKEAEWFYYNISKMTTVFVY